MAVAALAASMLVSCSSGGAGSVSGQIRFGADMARRGLWNEARFRWERALAARPDDPHLLANLAVAAEATGDFALALKHYRRALELAPHDSRIEKNYARFAEFYSNYTRGRIETPALPNKVPDDVFRPPPPIPRGR